MSTDIPINLTRDTQSRVEEVKKLTFKPASDIYETNDQVVILLEMPNIDRASLRVTIKDGLLKISGEKKKYNEGSSGEFLLHETKEGTYERIFQLDNDIDEDHVEAQYKNGLLSVYLKKKLTPRRIEIK